MVPEHIPPLDVASSHESPLPILGFQTVVGAEGDDFDRGDLEEPEEDALAVAAGADEAGAAGGFGGIEAGCRPEGNPSEGGGSELEEVPAVYRCSPTRKRVGRQARPRHRGDHLHRAAASRGTAPGTSRRVSLVAARGAHVSATLRRKNPRSIRPRRQTAGRRRRKRCGRFAPGRHRSQPFDWMRNRHPEPGELPR